MTLSFITRLSLCVVSFAVSSGLFSQCFLFILFVSFVSYMHSINRLHRRFYDSILSSNNNYSLVQPIVNLCFFFYSCCLLRRSPLSLFTSVYFFCLSLTRAHCFVLFPALFLTYCLFAIFLQLFLINIQSFKIVFPRNDIVKLITVIGRADGKVV